MATSLESYAKYKLLKCQMNTSCDSGAILEMNVATLFSGSSIVEVSNKVINLQPSASGKIMLSSLNVNQPASKQSTLPLDFLPGFTNTSPRKTFEIPLEMEFEASARIIGLTFLL